MAYLGSLPDITNQETWDLALQLYDAEVGPDEYIDLTDAVVTMTIRDQRTDCAVITASSTSGDIEITTDPGTIKFNFADGRLVNLCGTYNVAIRITANDITRGFFRGTVAILEGFDRQ